MSKDHAEYRTNEQISAEIAEMKREIEAGKISEDEAERDASFADPANAEETNAMLERMRLVEALYSARQEAGLTQKELADRIGIKQTYIAQIECGRKNITISTMLKYAAACGKRVSITLL